MQCPGIPIRLDDEGQLAQQVRAAQAVAAVLVRQIGGPTVMDGHPPIAIPLPTTLCDAALSLECEDKIRDTL